MARLSMPTNTKDVRLSRKTGSERRAVKVTRLTGPAFLCRPIGAELTTQIGSAIPRGRRTFEMRLDGGTQSRLSLS
jgi:hypothetical protein